MNDNAQEIVRVNGYIPATAWHSIVRIRREWLLLLGSLLVIAALYNHYIGHSAYLVEIMFVAAGILIGVGSLFLPSAKTPEAEDGILVRIMSRLIPKKLCAILLPLIWKITVAGKSDLHLEDYAVTLFGLSLVLYYSGPSKYTAQKDFVVLYLMFMTFVFVVLWKTYTMTTGDAGARLSANVQYHFITVPVVFFLQLMGVDATAILIMDNVPSLSNYIDYPYDGRTLTLGVGVTCSGLYSAGLFFSAFLSFVLVRYRLVDRYIMLGLAAGLFVTWISNIFRMTITVLIGSIYGHPALSFFHSYFGIVVFIIFLTIFWMLIVRWLDKREMPESPPPPQAAPQG
jgi:exosortase/archaeosortase family protein